mmetsp:Transcript_16052/g.45417  ORF Transcript_16052/g.45417 Transcript_16052/m.45417 type:complete len:114 (-) Transcript_16052:42-383(-)
MAGRAAIPPPSDEAERRRLLRAVLRADCSKADLDAALGRDWAVRAAAALQAEGVDTSARALQRASSCTLVQAEVVDTNRRCSQTLLQASMDRRMRDGAFPEGPAPPSAAPAEL